MNTMKTSITLILCLFLPFQLYAQEKQSTYDTVISNERVIDPGSNLDAIRNVEIIDGEIRTVSTVSLLDRATLAAGTPMEAAGQIDDLDAWVAALMAEQQIPGLSLVVVQNGSIVKAGHYGLANVELNVPVNEETSFKIASMSKAFTAAALMLLVEDGSVSLDDRVTSHLDGLPSSWDDITLHQLANNTAGQSNDWDLHPGRPSRLGTWTINSSDYFLHNSTDDAFLRALADLPLLFTLIRLTNDKTKNP